MLESRWCLGVLDEAGGFGSALEMAGGSVAGLAFRTWPTPAAAASQCRATTPATPPGGPR